jgi:hypothetical protein
MRIARMVCAVGIAVAISSLVLRSHAQADNLSANTRVVAFLRAYLNDPALGGHASTVSMKTIPAQGSGPEDIVAYVRGRHYCGSGGCRLLVLTPKGSPFNVLGETMIVQLPVEYLGTRTHRHADLAVFVAGGGILPGYFAKLVFDGYRYPLNPSMHPAQRIAKPQGQILFAAPVP